MNHFEQKISTIEAQKETESERISGAQSRLIELEEECSRQKAAMLIVNGVVPMSLVNSILGQGSASNLSQIRQTSGTKKVAGKGVGAPLMAVTSEVPTMINRLKTIMGERSISVDDIIVGLTQREGWLPPSKNIKSYVSSVLSANPDFVNVARGTYAVNGSKAAEKATQEKQEETGGKSKATSPEHPKILKDAMPRGALPPLRDRVKIVMGSETLTIPDILARLAEKDWDPNGDDPRAYLAVVLSAERTTFKRVSRGHYCVAEAVVEGPTEKSSKLPVLATATNGAPNKPKITLPDLDDSMSTQNDVDMELETLGVTGELSMNPFQP